MSYSKYGNKRTAVDGITFASRAEARHYGRLRLMERAGLISNLQTQVRYPLVVNGTKIAVYIADFVYTDVEGRKMVIDVKGVRLPVYKIKKNLMKALHSVDIIEVA